MKSPNLGKVYCFVRRSFPKLEEGCPFRYEQKHEYFGSRAFDGINSRSLTRWPLVGP